MLPAWQVLNGKEKGKLRCTRKKGWEEKFGSVSMMDNPIFWSQDQIISCTSSIMGLFISNPFEGRLIQTGGLFDLAETMVWILHKELEYIFFSGKAQIQELGGHAAEDQKQILTSSWWINHPGSVHMKFYSHDWLIQSINKLLLVKNN